MARRTIDASSPPAVRAALGDLGALISAARREQRMTQADLATRVGVTRATIARMERGDGGVAVGWLLTTAWVLGLPLLRWSDFAAARDTSSVGVFLDRLGRNIPQRVRPPHLDDTEDENDGF